MSIFMKREHVEAIACCLVREYLFRKSQEIQVRLAERVRTDRLDGRCYREVAPATIHEWQQ